MKGGIKSITHYRAGGRIAVNSYREAAEAFRKKPTLLKLHCGVQHYEWGDFDTIPALLGLEQKTRQPYAELWMGAHHDMPSQALVGDQLVPLNQLVEAAAEALLGDAVIARFGRQLPILFKVLSAGKPLSIQVHPDKKMAAAGFARENELNIALTSELRNYKDANHKPEMIAALTDFYAMCGFRPLSQIADTFASLPEFKVLATTFDDTNERSLRQLYSRIMTMPQSEVNAILTPLVDRLNSADRETPYCPDQFEYWLLQADRFFSTESNKERGLFSIALFNLIHLKPGEAIQIPIAAPHLYLGGAGLEVMANSNNVLRGGLTRKHVDVAELMRVMDFSALMPQRLTIQVDRRQPSLSTYPQTAAEYHLCRIDLRQQQRYCCAIGHSVQIIIVIAGRVRLKCSDGTRYRFCSGAVFLVPPAVGYEVVGDDQATLFLTGVPNGSANEDDGGCH